MSKKLSAILLMVMMLQSCHVPVIRDYQGSSKSLVFTENKKWLINEIESDFTPQIDEHLNGKILKTFNDLSQGNAVSLSSARSHDLMLANFRFSSSHEELATLQSTDYHYLVNVRTKQVNDQIASMELITPVDYRKNEAFAIVEVYEIKSGKKIYHQKASSAVTDNSRKRYPTNSAEEVFLREAEGKRKD